jgi:hypothetical protein
MAWAIGFLEGGWTLKWMAWSRFVEMVKGGNLEPICKSGADLIIGGFSLATDYMYV